MEKKNENPVSGSIPCLKQGFMVGFFLGGGGEGFVFGGIITRNVL